MRYPNTKNLLPTVEVTTVEIVAHRGASHDAPENTRAAMLLAWQQGADAVEIDIHLSGEGELVVMHDSNTLRTTGLDATVAGLTRHQRQQLDAGCWKGPQFVGEPVPTLDEILAILPSDKRLFIEIKGDKGNEIFAPLKQSIERAGVCASQIAVIGFEYEQMESFKRLMSPVQVSWLRGESALNAREKKNFEGLLDETIRLCRAANLDGLNLPRGWLESTLALERVKSSGLRLDAHTINDGTEARRLVATGVDGITTDRPAYLRAEFATNASVSS